MKKLWSFEYQWKNYDTKYLTYGLSKEAEFRKFCRDLNIKPEDLQDKRILDAGCGSGRLTKYISKFSKDVYGIDLIPLPQDKHVKFIRANIMDLPFEDSYFDLVYCEGVIHHTPTPEKVFMELARVNKNKLFVMVYSKRNIFMLIRRYLMTYKYPYLLTKLISFLFALIAYIPANILRLLLQTNRKFTIKSLEFSIFDYLSPEYQSIHSFSEVKKWFKEAGYNHIIKISNKGTEVLGIKK